MIWVIFAGAGGVLAELEAAAKVEAIFAGAGGFTADIAGRSKAKVTAGDRPVTLVTADDS